MSVEADDNKFTWGDSVIIRKNSPAKFHPGEFASVCGFYKVQSKETAKELECKIGDWVYTVEFGGGSDIQVPECYLDRDFSIVRGGELSKYATCFIDGAVSEINLDLDCIRIKMKSSFSQQHIPENNFILKGGVLYGLLTITEINKSVIKNSNYSPWQRHVGSILSFEISDHVLKLHIEWEKTRITSFEIEADQIWWQQECAD